MTVRLLPTDLPIQRDYKMYTAYLYEHNFRPSTQNDSLTQPCGWHACQFFCEECELGQTELWCRCQWATKSFGWWHNGVKQGRVGTLTIVYAVSVMGSTCTVLLLATTKKKLKRSTMVQTLAIQISDSMLSCFDTCFLLTIHLKVLYQCL